MNSECKLMSKNVFNLYSVMLLVASFWHHAQIFASHSFRKPQEPGYPVGRMPRVCLDCKSISTCCPFFSSLSEKLCFTYTGHINCHLPAGSLLFDGCTERLDWGQGKGNEEPVTMKLLCLSRAVR